MIPFEKFANLADVSSALLRALDVNFRKINETETSPLSVTVDYTLSSTDTIDSLQVDVTSTSVTVYLPSSPTGNRRRRIIKTDSSVNTVTIDGNGSLINGASTYTLASQYDRLWVEPTGTGWLIIN